MRITDLDKRQAIKRHPEFKKDYAGYKKLKADEILSFLPYFKKKWGYEFEAILHADEVAKKRKDSRSVKVVHNLPNTPYINPCKGEKTTPILKDNKLYLKVDLKGKTKTQLVEDFKETIKPYIELLKKRNRKTAIAEGIWAIYDIYLEAKKNKTETTRRYFGLSGSPSGSYNGAGYFDEKYLKQVQTAIMNAEAIIRTVRKEYGLK
jgi:hypothetical protein